MSMYFTHNHLFSKSDDVFESIFYVNLDHSQINAKNPLVYVKLKNDAMDFFYEDDNINHPVNVHQHVHLFSVPLDSKERTDFFFLNTRDYDGKVTSKDSSVRLFYASEIPDDLLLEVPNGNRLATTNELMLCLIDELYNSSSDINKFCDKTAVIIREKLEKSEVFKLIRKKYGFFKTLCEWRQASTPFYMSGNVKASYNEYLRTLLDGSITKEISVQKLEPGNWFQNPEYELQFLANLNLKYSFEPETTDDIQNHFLTKHAVLSAIGMKSLANLRLQVVGQVMTFIFFISVYLLWLGKVFEKTDILLLIGLVSFLITLIGGAVLQSKLAIFSPRIVIAVSSAWFIVLASEDIMKNQVTVDRFAIFITLPLIIFLLSVFIYSECKQHSPYYKFKDFTKRVNYKIIPIFIFTFNFAMAFGVVAQILVSNRIIDNSQILQDHKYVRQFDTLQIFKMKYQGLSDKLTRAEQSCAFAYSFFSTANIESSVIESSSKADLLTIKNIKSREDKVNSLLGYITTYNQIRKELVISNSDFIIKDIKKRNCWQYFLTFQSYLPHNLDIHDSISILNMKKKLKEDFDSYHQADDICSKIIDTLNEIYYTYKRYDSLVSLTTFHVKGNYISSKHYKVDYGFNYDTTREHIYSMLPFSSIQKKYKTSEFRLFPRMLMFQVLIVIFIALISQLIVSDKSVTEPL